MKIKIIILCFVFGLAGYKSFAVIPDTTYRFYPEHLGLIYKDLNVATPDGLKIETWFFPAQTALSEKEIDSAWANPIKKTYKVLDKTKRPTVIICNGDAGNMSWTQLGHVQDFTAKGYNVVTFDWRGFGKSSQWEMDTDYLVYTEFLTDYDAVIEQVLLQDEVDTSRIAVFGWSTGAYLSMAAARKYESIRCLIAIGLITSFEEALPILQKLPKNKSRTLIVPSDYAKEIQPIYLASTFKKATFLIVGELDDRSPAWMSEKIYAQLPGKKELWIIEGAEHGGMKGPHKDFALLNKRIVGFLDNNMK